MRPSSMRPPPTPTTTPTMMEVVSVLLLVDAPVSAEFRGVVSFPGLAGDAEFTMSAEKLLCD